MYVSWATKGSLREVARHGWVGWRGLSSAGLVLSTPTNVSGYETKTEVVEDQLLTEGLTTLESSYKNRYDRCQHTSQLND